MQKRVKQRYIFCAVLLNTKFGFAYTYKSLTSENAKDFIKKMLMLKDLKRNIQEHFVVGTPEDLIEPEKFNLNPINL
ncbi:MAG: hypothetical protein ABIN73_09575 [candidate division WOR-3 bacterium]